jgi:hypothetical protein
MKRPFTRETMTMRRLFVVTLIILGALTLGCGDSGPAPENPTATAAMSPEEVEAAVATLLARADLADETEDKVVEKCLGCALGMDGAPDQVVQAHGYEIHFCSPACKENAEENIEEAILALRDLEEPGTEATN